MRAHAIKTISAALFLALACGGTAFAQKVELKAKIDSSGPTVTLGDLFENAGAMADRAVAQAPAIGARTTLSARFLAAAASAAGLEWSPPAGMDEVTVTRSGVQRAAFTPTAAAIKRGDIVTLTYVAPGLQLTTRAKAANDAAAGKPVRLINLQSGKTIEATATGPGAASANGVQSF